MLEIDLKKLKNFIPYLTQAGFPIWWGIAPRIIETFLERYDFSGKTIIPFCTSGGSGVGRSDTALHKNVNGDVKWAKKHVWSTGNQRIQKEAK